MLYACTKTLRRVPTHSPCGRIAGAMRSAWCGDFTACRIFSRCIDSSSGPLVSATSMVCAVGARLLHGALQHLLAEPARQTLTLMPYFFSKAATSAPMSSVCAEV